MSASPPASYSPVIIDLRQGSEQSTEALLSQCVQGLQQPEGKKSLPTILLYDERGLQIFDRITYLEEYYPTNAEAQILRNRAHELVRSVPDQAVLVELGAGSLRKTKIVLDAFEEARKPVSYYALDLSEPELRKSLEKLGHYDYVETIGLWGEYSDGMAYLRHVQSTGRPLLVMWLGSSIGNLHRDDSDKFVRKLSQFLNPGDQLLIGMDKRKEAPEIELAYNDPHGVTRDFILNGLRHLNHLMGREVFDAGQFEYVNMYVDSAGRHEAYLKPLRDMSLSLSVNGYKHPIELKAGELIFIECSYKYSDDEISNTGYQANLLHIAQWETPTRNYSLNLFEKPSFSFNNLRCTRGLPSLAEWLELWKAWDTVTDGLVRDDAVHTQPIKLRHPLLFYYGHVPTFLDLMVSRALGEPYTEPQRFSQIFERGIDPDVDDPSCCHPHSDVPDSQDQWPTLEQIRDYKQAVRRRLMHIYDQGERLHDPRLARAIWMSFEHAAMHLETFLYALVQRPDILKRPPTRLQTWDAPRNLKEPIESAHLIAVAGGEVMLGCNDDELVWDCELPATRSTVAPFEIQDRPVSVGEYYAFVQERGIAHPHSWMQCSESSFGLGVCSMYGPIPLEKAWHWPVSVSLEEANFYARCHGCRLPTEPELRFVMSNFSDPAKGNVCFLQWSPSPLLINAEPTWQFYTGGWELTSSLFTPFEGFCASEEYPGYSQDFFDGKHYVVLGGSWATHPRLLRPSFRNWYHIRYPYAFTQFRCVRDRTVADSARVA